MRRRKALGVRVAKATIVPLLSAVAAAYFATHAVYGNFGLEAKMRLEREMDTRQRELAILKSERARLERDVALLSPDSLDPDLLEERVRAVLLMARPDDRLVLTNR